MLVGALLAALMLWPSQKDAGTTLGPEHGMQATIAASPTAGRGQPKAPPATPLQRPSSVRERKAPPTTRKTTQVSPIARARRDLLLAAIRARAASLRPCVPANAAEARVPVRLHLERSGAVKAVEFAGQPPARDVRDCVRRVTTGWNFRDVELPSDVELFATLTLTSST